ncbi:MAG: protein-methionine-sulfoxide reductase heme-binding subunit MsrQ [Methylococcaceae bacterium]
MNFQIKNPKLVTFVACLIPLLWLCFDIAFDNLGSNPIQALHIRLGDWSWRFLCITLAITPIQTMTKWRGMTDYRQMFGLYAFFYATLHLLTYLVVDNNLMWSIIGTDIIESPYIWFGVVAYLIVFSLAITSPKWAMKRMGKSWKKLHRLVYVAAIAAIIHYFWQLKGNLAEPLLYLIIIFFLLGFRVLAGLTSRQLNKMMIPKGHE